MSLLLDALKKAAQEKLENQHRSEQLKQAPASQDEKTEAENNIPPSVHDGRSESRDAESSQGSSWKKRTAAGAVFPVQSAPAEMELEPLEEDELHIDADAFSKNTETDYEHRRADVLASELKAFNGDTDLPSPATGRGDSQDFHNIEEVEPVWNIDSQQTGTPQQAEQVFSNKTPDHRSRLFLLIGIMMLTTFAVAGMFAYDYLANINQSSVINPRQPLPATTKASASPGEEEVDPMLLIEQEDYGDLLEADSGDELIGSERGQQALSDGSKSARPRTAAVEPKLAVPAGKNQAPRSTAIGEGQLSISKTIREPLQDVLMRGYTAYNRGEFENAEVAYRQALTRAPDSRDAMLGIAAVRFSQGDTLTSIAYYQKLLQRDPKDELALAALAGIENGDVQKTLTKTDVSDESRIKLLLAEKPDSSYLHFALGNIFANERRWAEAQRVYFDAYRLEPGNPDYAFNLAVSLDHLGKKNEAVRYYQQSLALAQQRKPNFNTQVAVDRLASLEKL